MINCPWCNGTGKRSEVYKSYNSENDDCFECGGTGLVEDGYQLYYN